MGGSTPDYLALEMLSDRPLGAFKAIWVPTVGCGVRSMPTWGRAQVGGKEGQNPSSPSFVMGFSLELQQFLWVG